MTKKCKPCLWTKKIDEKIYILEEIKHNYFMKLKKVYKALNYFWALYCFCFFCQWLCLYFCFCFISWCSCMYCILCRRIKICATAGIKKYKSIINEERKKFNTVLLAKSKLLKFWFLKTLLTHALVMSCLFQWIMCKENFIRWKKKSKILKMLWNILYKNNGNLLC